MPSTVIRPTKKSFIILWQLAGTLEDVLDSLNKAGCTDGWGDKIKIHSLKAMATRIRNRDKINLKTLPTIASIKEAGQKVKELDNLRFLADALLAFGEEAQVLATV